MTETEISDALDAMENDSSYNTTSAYSANIERYPDNIMPFKDKHLTYIKSHKITNPNQYISNLKLMTKIR